MPEAGSDVTLLLLGQLRAGKTGCGATMLSFLEMAEAMRVSPSTVKREWRLAKARLQLELAAAKSG